LIIVILDASCVYAKLQTMRTIVDKDVDIIIENERAKRRNDAEIERLIGELRNMQRFVTFCLNNF